MHTPVRAHPDEFGLHRPLLDDDSPIRKQLREVLSGAHLVLVTVPSSE